MSGSPQGVDRRRPRTVYQAGEEPDPRFSLANERTFLAWIRTTLALVAGAVGVHALDLGVTRSVGRATSSLLAAAGLLCAVQAGIGWVRTERALREGRPLPSNAVGVVLVVPVALTAAIMVIVGIHG